MPWNFDEKAATAGALPVALILLPSALRPKADTTKPEPCGKKHSPCSTRSIQPELPLHENDSLTLIDKIILIIHKFFRVRS